MLLNIKIKSENSISRLPKYNHKVSFGAGNCQLYFDYDNTFMPREFNHKVLGTKEKPFDEELFKKVFAPFSDFLRQMKEKLELIITSGRNYYEFKHNIGNIPKELDFPMPKFLITSNGADVLEKKGNGIKYVFADLAKEKESEIETLSGWNITKIKKFTNKILQNKGFEVIESKVNNTKKEYPGLSIEDELQALNKTNIDNFASIRTNEHLHFNLAFSDKTSDEQISEIVDEITKKLSFHNINTAINIDCKGDYNGGYKIINITPKIKDETLTKLFDTKKAVSKALKDNDLVIIAGDSGNDKEMLNLFRYIDVSKYGDFPVKSWDGSSDVLQEQIRQAFEYLKHSPAMQKEMDNLPLTAIIVDNASDTKYDKLACFKEFFPLFNHDGIVKFINIKSETCENPSGLLDGIKTAIKNYASQNQVFAAKLAEGLNPQINKELSLVNISDKSVKTNKNKLIIAALALSAGIISALKLIQSRNSNKENFINTNNFYTFQNHNGPKIFSNLSLINK